MNFRLLLLLLFLCALIIPAQLSKHEKHDKHDKPAREEKKDKHGEKHGEGHGPKSRERHGKRRGRVEDLLKDYEDPDDSSDDEDEEKGEWLFEIQNVRGNCTPNPCLNNGVCEESRGRFKCKCPKNFKGRKCERGRMVCRRNTCGHGLCLLTSKPPFFECKCKAPFKPPNCKTIAPCDPSPCLNGGTCVKDGQDFDCDCKEGFSGRFCHVGPDDCYTGDGESYRGKVSETDDGDDCLFWNSHFILGKGINPFSKFEDTEGLGPHNFCRNPDGDTMPWCFVRVGKKLKWEHCNVRKCPSPNGTITAAPPVPKPTTAKPVVVDPTVRPTPALLHPSPSDPPITSHHLESPAPTAGAGLVPAPAVLTEPRFATCGKPQPKKSMNRIYGGLKALPGAQPWQASVQVRPKGTTVPFRHICGGILIKPCWVMTAAHCIDKRQDFRVTLGDLDLGKVEPTDQTVEVVETIVHEQYKETPQAVYNDIGLLRLKFNDGRCAEENQFVKTACLPTEPFPDGTECTISGWGATQDAQYGTNQLLDADVLLISQDVCSSSKIYGKAIDQSMFCAGFLEGGVDSCQGDSGGPLTCQRNQTHYVYGIVSWGDSCGEKDKPGVYTRVTHFLDWINAKTSSAPA